MRNVKLIALILVVALLISPLALAQDGEISESVKKIIEEIENEGKEDSNTAKEQLNKEAQPLVSTVFFNEDIRDVLTEVAMQTGVNIIFDETVVGTITLDLVDVPLEQALEMILISGGYTYHKVNDYYLVGRAIPASPMYQKLTETETIRLNYLSAAAVIDLLPPFYSDFLRTSSARDNMITISAPQAVIDEFKKDLSKIDTAPQELEIEVIVTEVSKEVLTESGSNLFGINNLESPDEYSIEYDGVFDFQFAGSAGQLIAELRALEEDGKASIRANPSIRVSDKESAEIFIGEERVIILNREDEDDVVEDVEVGVSLEVTPQIMAENDIRMEIAPDVSHFTNENGEQLIIRRSELSSVLRAKSGETVTMAGMTLDKVMEFESKVPLLGDLPLLRWLFSEESEKESERELLVFITPRIISE
jgi:type IV pilus assembly protein PilQ